MRTACLAPFRVFRGYWKRIAACAASRQQGVSYRVEQQLPPDVLSIYIYLPTL